MRRTGTETARPAPCARPGEGQVVRLRVGTLLLSFAIASVLWIMAHGTSSIERGVDIPVVFSGIPDDLVITDQTAEAVKDRKSTRLNSSH